MAFYDPTTDPDYPAPSRRLATGFDCTGIALMPAATVVALIMMLSSGGDGRVGITHTGSPTPTPPSQSTSPTDPTPEPTPKPATEPTPKPATEPLPDPTTEPTPNSPKESRPTQAPIP
jgi:outer membrane biosynthesis protein TonB